MCYRIPCISGQKRKAWRLCDDPCIYVYFRSGWLNSHLAKRLPRGILEWLIWAYDAFILIRVCMMCRR